MVARLRGRPSPRPPSPSEKEPGVETHSDSTGQRSQRLLITVVVISLLATALSLGALWYLTLGPGQRYMAVNGSSQLEHVSTGPLAEIGPFIVNLGDVNERRYLRIGLSLDFQSANPAFVKGSQARKEEWMHDFQEHLKELEPIFKDVLLTTASAKLPQELGSSAGKESFKAELVGRFNRHLDAETRVHNVYFTDFVIQ